MEVVDFEVILTHETGRKVREFGWDITGVVEGQGLSLKKWSETGM